MEVLGGPRSKLFEKFRKYFFKGFMAVWKHREKILLLVRMMYSSHGTSLPCFMEGVQAITDLENRLNPPNVNFNTTTEVASFVNK